MSTIRLGALALVLALTGCPGSWPTLVAPPAPARNPPAPPAPRYPDVWFAPLPEAIAPYRWEITPDKAGKGEVILSKRNELGCLSNFAATPFELDGKRYASIEGLWQSLYFPEGPDDPRQEKGAPWKLTRAQVEQLSAFEAKNAGQEEKRRLKAAGVLYMSWRGRRFDPFGSGAERKLHLELIERATRAKVEQNPAVKDVLLRTGDLELRPDHDPGKDPPPAFRYFEILQRIRDELRK